MTKIWCGSRTDYTIADIHRINGPIPSVLGCTPLSGSFPDITIKVEPAHPPADFFHVGVMFTISEELKSVFEDFDVHAEFFLLRTIYKNREYKKRRFFVCNILDCVDCLDFKCGKYTFWKKKGFTDHVDKIRKLAIDEKKAAGHSVFRIAKGAEYIVVVSDDLANRIQQLGFTGVRLVDPTDWRFGTLYD